MATRKKIGGKSKGIVFSDSHSPLRKNKPKISNDSNINIIEKSQEGNILESTRKDEKNQDTHQKEGNNALNKAKESKKDRKPKKKKLVYDPKKMKTKSKEEKLDREKQIYVDTLTSTVSILNHIERKKELKKNDLHKISDVNIEGLLDNGTNKKYRNNKDFKKELKIKSDKDKTQKHREIKKNDREYKKSSKNKSSHEKNSLSQQGHYSKHSQGKKKSSIDVIQKEQDSKTSTSDMGLKQVKAQKNPSKPQTSSTVQAINVDSKKQKSSFPKTDESEYTSKSSTKKSEVKKNPKTKTKKRHRIVMRSIKLKKHG